MPQQPETDRTGRTQLQRREQPVHTRLPVFDRPHAGLLRRTAGSHNYLQRRRQPADLGGETAAFYRGEHGLCADRREFADLLSRQPVVSRSDGGLYGKELGLPLSGGSELLRLCADSAGGRGYSLLRLSLGTAFE